MAMRLAAALVAAAALGGCASGGMGGGVMNGIMASWQGATLDEAIAAWGYPHAERNIAGRRIFVWDRSLRLTMPATASTTGTAQRIGGTTYYSGTTTTVGGGTSDWSCTRMLEVNADNKVVSWQWEGNNCPFMEAGPYSNWRRK
jgi:hypothetical protein